MNFVRTLKTLYIYDPFICNDPLIIYQNQKPIFSLPQRTVYFENRLLVWFLLVVWIDMSLKIIRIRYLLCILYSKNHDDTVVLLKRILIFKLFFLFLCSSYKCKACMLPNKINCHSIQLN